MRQIQQYLLQKIYLVLNKLSNIRLIHVFVVQPKLYVGSLLVGIVSMQIACTPDAKEQKQKVSEKEPPKQPISFEPDSLEKHPQKKIIHSQIKKSFKKSERIDSLSLPIDIDTLSVPIEIVTCYMIIEPSATFQGGDLRNFNNWVMQNLQYPQNAIDSSYEGLAVLEFTVTKKGVVADVKIVKSSGYKVLDNEAIRVVMSSPQWQPATQGGSPVAQFYNLPIQFKLENK